MFTKTEYVIYLYGTNAARLAESFTNGSCYRQIIDHGKRLAQVEPTMDNLVDVTLYDLKYFDKVLKQLARLGFKGCKACICESVVMGCIANGKFIVGFEI